MNICKVYIECDLQGIILKQKQHINMIASFYFEITISNINGIISDHKLRRLGHLKNLRKYKSYELVISRFNIFTV